MVDNVETNQQPTESNTIQPQNLDSVLESVINGGSEITVDNKNQIRPELPNTKQSSEETVNNISIDQSENTEVNDDNIPNDNEELSSDNDSVVDNENDSLEAEQPDTDISDETTNTKTLEAPATWTESQREKFASLPIDQQEFVLEREKDTNKTFTQKTQELAEQRKGIENIINVLQPHTQQIQSSGIGVAEYIARLLQHDVQLRTDPQRALTQLAQAYNVNLGNNTGVDDVWADDSDQQQIIHPQIQNLQRQLGDTQAQLQSMQNQTRQEQYQSTLDEVERFAGMKDSKTGDLKYPHFDQLRESMGRLIHSGESKDLASAYNKALRLDDNLYNQQLEQARKSVSKQEEAKRKNAVSKAKKAGSGKNPATPPTGSMQLSSLDDVLKNAIGS